MPQKHNEGKKYYFLVSDWKEIKLEKILTPLTNKWNVTYKYM